MMWDSWSKHTVYFLKRSFRGLLPLTLKIAIGEYVPRQSLVCNELSEASWQANL